VELTRLSVAYGFADARLQRLEPAQKQLLRMGPENVKRVQAKLRELVAALETSGDAGSAAGVAQPGSPETREDSRATTSSSPEP